MSTNAHSPAGFLSHPLLTAAGCPSTGNGAQVYLQQLSRSLEACQELSIGSSATEWLKIVKTLRRAASANSSALASPGATELAQQPWGDIHACIDARGKVRAKSTQHLDVLLGLMLLQAAAGSKALTGESINGLRTCYTALSGKRKLHLEWELVATQTILDASQLTQLLGGLSHPPVMAFVQSTLNCLAKAMPTPAGTGPTQSQAESADLDVLGASSTLPQVDGHARPTGPDSVAAPNLAIELDEMSETSGAPFQRGDSIINWHLTQAQYSGRNSRLALDSWETLSSTQVCQMTPKLATLLADPASPWHHASILVTASLLTSTPCRVLLHASLDKSNDLRLDLDGQQFCWSIQMLTVSLENMPDEACQTWIAIPFPASFGAALQGKRNFMRGGVLRHFSDLFSAEPGSSAWKGLLRQTHDLLMMLGDPAYSAFPGRWANSMSRVYLDITQSDLLTSVCTLNLSLTPQAALHYFHPSAQDIRQVVTEVYEHLGLGPPVGEGPVSSQRGIPTDEQLRIGFQRLEERAKDLHTLIRSKRSNVTCWLAAANELTRLSASICVFLVGARGSRVDEMTCGAIYCSTDMLWLEDKKVAHEGSSRILPKPRHLQHWLHRQFLARQGLAERITSVLRRDLAASWRELATGQLRFDAPAFEVIELHSGRVKRCQVTPAEIEAVAQEYFGSGKNVMRHVLVTHWALDRDDRHLLRLITGHARSSLAMPAAGAMYTPQSAAAAAKKVLEKHLNKWLPVLDEVEVEHRHYQFVGLPGRRIQQVHARFRKHLESWDAQVLSRWHLAAVRIMDRIRDLLLNGHGPEQLPARLWLHLVTFEGLTEPGDLKDILSQVKSAAVLGPAGWVIKIARPGSADPLTTAVQPPTAFVLGRIAQSNADQPLPYQLLLNDVDKWLAEATPDCWGDPRDGVADSLLACSRLWADWVLPPALQLCYGVGSHAPVLDAASVAALYRLEPQTGSAIQAHSPRVRSRKGNLDNLYQVINRLGSSRHRLGEQKKRARLFERWAAFSQALFAGELASTLIKVISVNVVRIRAGKRNAIEWSSQATYLSTLRPYLNQIQYQNPDDFDVLDWLEFCQTLLSFASEAQRQTVPASEAADWLMGCLRDAGYPLPPRDALKQKAPQPVANSTVAIAAMTQHQIDSAKSIAATLSGSPLQKSRLGMAMDLLCSQPLRQGELAAISINNVTADGQLCITTGGFAHLKSHAARRRLALTTDVNEAMTQVLARIREIAVHSPESLVFGSQHLRDGTTALDATWITSAITWAIQTSTSNPNFRIHSLRAHVVANILCPNWREVMDGVLSGQTGPRAITQLFGYTSARAWITDQARLAAGHASIRTTLSYYFHAWLPVRFLALHATLSAQRPSEYLLQQIGVSVAALVKACARVASYRDDPWRYIQHKLPTRLPIPAPSDKGGPARRLGLDSTPKPVDKPEDHHATESTDFEHLNVRYLGLRMLGLDQCSAHNLVDSLGEKEISRLEARLASLAVDSSRLRGRIRGDISGRAVAADVRQMQAHQTTLLIGKLAKMPPSQLNALLQLLLPGHEMLTWDDALAQIAPWLSDSEICVEVVTDIRAVDPALNLKLSRLGSVLIGSPAHDVGALPRLFIQPRDPNARNTVVKARWTTLVRVLCTALLAVNTPKP